MRVDEAEPPVDRLIEAGFRDAWGPDGETVDDRFTVPAKPFKLFRVTAVVPEAPWEIVNEVGFEVTPKSGVAVAL